MYVHYIFTSERKLHKDGENYIMCSNTVRVIKSRRMKLVGFVACVREMITPLIILVGKPEDKRPLYRPGHRRRKMLK